MPAHERLRHHKAKIQYRAWKETIFQMMEQGYSKRLIHEELTKDGAFPWPTSRFASLSETQKNKRPRVQLLQTKAKCPLLHRPHSRKSSRRMPIRFKIREP